MAAMAPQRAPDNEPDICIRRVLRSEVGKPPEPIKYDAWTSRTTREGKKLTYLLHVLQQPQRARACGAGAKSSADRRPVDPPPVIEMLVYESDPHDPEKPAVDVTFAYNANFFLYATLETARPMAQGRLPSPAPSCAVLTGVPVAGVAYLDRPMAAGYFIFPDLSVRHEGLYRLCFHLYEQTKESRDETEGTLSRPTPAPGKLGAPHQFLDYRLEVCSDPFTVYSAKKFPGLNESTGLSRTIAEQGCRVRIRREVRMRRRGDKRADGFDCDDDRGYNSRRGDRFARPDAYGNAPERHRSASISTIDPYAYSQRRPSGQEYGPSNPQHYQRPMPHTPIQSSTPIPTPIMAPGPLAVPSSTPSPATAHAPSIPPAPMLAQPPLHTPSYQSSQPSHLAFNSTQTQYPAPPQYPAPSQTFAQPTTTMGIMHSPRLRNPSISAEYDPSRYGSSHPRPSMERQGYAQPPPPTPMTPLPPIRTLDTQPGEGHPPLELLPHHRSRTPSENSLPPIRPLPEFTSTSSQPSSSIGSSPAANDYGPAKGAWETTQTLSKRTYEESFGHDDRPLRNGMRPDSDSYFGSLQRRPSYERHPFFDDTDGAMIYKRAMITASIGSNDLQNSLLSSCRSQDTYSYNHSYGSRTGYSSRGHGYGYGYGYEWEASASRSSCESDFLSEVSGQFDDAEESEVYSPPRGLGDEPNYCLSTHSVKRRRSNDWPRQPGDANNNDSGGHSRSGSGSGTWQRWPFGHHRRHGSSHGSPRSPRHVRPGRRSRFVEGHMNDTVSTKPPSIFFPDEARTGSGNGNEVTAASTRAANRNFGIFRFGKAIASAFNPFGGWGSVSDIWRSSQVQTPEVPEPATNDRLKQAQLAYEELKRSGYQGTNKGSYMASMGATNLPSETWKSIQEKMQYGSDNAIGSSGANAATAGQHSRQSSGSSLRPSFPDLRKAKSSLGAPSKKQDGQEVRHQKSRKDLQKQAKLLKRVSNLEDKLERAWRELRELSGSGEEEPLPRSNLNQERSDERPYQRKFIPGALPSLPSERLLHGPHPKTTTPLSPLLNGTLQAQAQAPNPGPEAQTQSEAEIRVNKTRYKSPRPWRKPSGPRSLSAHSSSRKRKSPDPESRKRPDTSESEQPPPIPPIYQQQQQDDQTPQALQPEPEPEPEAAARTASRKPKLPKTARGDSPGSVERKQRRSPAASVEGSASPGEERAGRGRPLRSTNRNRSVTPVLRMKRGRGDLRSTTSPADRPRFDDDKENQNHNHGVKGDEDVEDLTGEPETFTEPPSPSISSTPSRRKARYEYIPPVPPLPKDLAATAAKVDQRLARQMGKRKVQKDRVVTGLALTGDDAGAVPGIERGKGGAGQGPGFQWPEDIF
ncbi:velvet factor-domain-containing protein [Aspergillus oleicola]